MQIEGNSRTPVIDNIAPDVGNVKPARVEYGPDIERYARQYGVDPDMVAAIMQKESGGAPNPIVTTEAGDLNRTYRESTPELNGRAATVLDLQQRNHVESICRALREECFGSIYDEKSRDADEDDDE